MPRLKGVTNSTRILLTGGTGFLGGAVAASLAAAGQAALYLVRAKNPEEGLERLRETLRRFGATDFSLDALRPEQIVCGDLGDAAAFAEDSRLDTVTHVINSAAVASFANNPQIWPVNVEGTFAFARRMARAPRLRRFLHIGTAMACGPGSASPVMESWDMAPAEEQFVPYTASKAEIERRLRAELPALPLVVARPSVVVGHARLGCTPSGSIFWVFRMAQMLERFTCGLDEKIDVIPADYCADALIALALKDRLAHDLYHISAGPDYACTFGEIDIALAAGRGIEPVGARYRKIGKDELAALAHDFESLVGPCNRRLMLRAMRLYGGFAELNYLFDNRRLLAEDIPPPPRLTDYIGLCAQTSEHVPIPEQMRWDFK